MQFLKFTLRGGSFLCLALALAIVGCDANELGKSGNPPAESSRSVNLTEFVIAEPGTAAKGGSGVAVLHRNNDRSLKKDKPSAIGRDRDVTVTADATRDANGITTVVVTSSEGDSGTPEGTLSKIQLKALDGTDPDPDNPAWVENFNKLKGGAEFTRAFSNLERNQPLFVHANVKGIIRGTAVVKLLEVVKLLPDLSVVQLNAPEKAVPGQTVSVEGVISELNGDLGASYECVLYVDGIEHDRIPNAMTEAHESDSCVFQPSFSAEGSYQLQVAVENASPDDYDASNNAMSVTLDVEEELVTNSNWYVKYSQEISSWEIDYDDCYEDWYTRYRYCYDDSQIDYEYWDFLAYAQQYNSDVTSFPVDFLASASVGGKELFNITENDFGPSNADTGYENPGLESYAQKYYPELNVWASVYIREWYYGYDPFTSINANRYFGNNVYYSRSTFDTGDYVYSHTVGEGIRSPIDGTETGDVSVKFELTKGEGAIVANVAVPLLHTEVNYFYSYWLYTQTGVGSRAHAECQFQEGYGTVCAP